MLIFSIESSCDETAAAVVENGIHEVASVVASSKDFHEQTGGIVPEIAARKQVESIVPVINETLKSAAKVLGVKNVSEVSSKIDALAVTVGPGLIGSLLVGVEAAKALSLAWNKPLIPVNHLVGHIYGNFVDSDRVVQFPALVLIVSGGHTDLVLMKNHGEFTYLGGTLDDAAGEAFDKTARLLGLSKYLGGVQLSNKASQYKATKDSKSFNPILPRVKINDPDFDFSFSGLKTAVKRLIDSHTLTNDEIAYDFENAVVEVLVKKTINAAIKHNVKSVLLGGGVAANSWLKKNMEDACSELKLDLFIPPLRLCTDNAVYIGSAAFFNQTQKPLDKITANPSLGIMDKV